MELNRQEWFTQKEVCARLGMDSRMFRYYVSKGLFPRGIRRGKKMKVWSSTDIIVMIWLEGNRRRLRPDAPPKVDRPRI